MKKNIMLVLLGMLIMAVITVGVYAIGANEITYNNTTVDQALDDLYDKATITGADLIVNKAEAVTSLTFTPSSTYKYYILTNIYFSATLQYSTWINNVNINTITNASYILTGLTGRNGSSTSGASRSFLIVPDGSGNDIVVTFNGYADAASVYGIK